MPDNLTSNRDLAAALAHRACCGVEHDPANGKLHGYCVVCGVPWPCETAQLFLRRPEPPSGLQVTAAISDPDLMGTCLSCGQKSVVPPSDALSWMQLRAGEDSLFQFLTNKYVQRQDARQREMALQYMEAETRDLAKSIAAYIRPPETKVAPPALGFGIPFLIGMVKERMQVGESQEEAIAKVSEHNELRSEAISALRAAFETHDGLCNHGFRQGECLNLRCEHH